MTLTPLILTPLITVRELICGHKSVRGQIVYQFHF